MKLIKLTLLAFVAVASTTFADDEGRTLVYETRNGNVYVPPTKPLVFTNEEIQDSYREKVYDNWGYLKRGVYYQTHPVRKNDALEKFDRDLAQAMWPD